MHDVMICARLLRHHKGIAVPTKAGRSMVGDHGALQAELFDAFFGAPDHGAHGWFSTEYGDADSRHFLGVVQNRLGDRVPLSEFAGWCLPLDVIRSYRFSPMQGCKLLCVFAADPPLLWLGMIAEMLVNARVNIDRRFRKTPLFGRFLYSSVTPPEQATVH